MIESLTPEQEALLPVYRDRWRKIGLDPLPQDCDVVSDEELRSIVDQVYECGGLTPPSVIVRAKSLRDCYVKEAIWRKVCEEGMTEEEATVAVDDSKVSTATWPVWGCYDAGWCGWAEFVDEELKVPGAEKSRGLRRLAKVAGFCLAFRDVFIWSPKHTEIHLDDDGELHNEEGPAIRYPDGFAEYCVHGHVVPEYVILRPHEITVEAIQAETEAETRRIMTDRFTGGPGAWLEAVGAEVVDMDEVVVNPSSGRKITRVLYHGPNDTAYFAAPDGSTQRVYFMPVDREHTTCKAAHNSIMPLGMTEDHIIAQG